MIAQRERWIRNRQRFLLVVALALLPVIGLPARTQAETSGDGIGYGKPGLHRLYADFDNLPGVEGPKIRSLWTEALQLEAENRLIESAEIYERIIRELPTSSLAYWRASRNYFRVGDTMPVEEKEQRIRYFTIAEERAAAGLEVDPSCGGCCLYKFSAMASLAMTRGLWTGVRTASEMADLLDRGIELRPTHSDNAWNTTLGNLYYAASQFYRVMPDWFWLKWILGTRGDNERALQYARQAHAISPMRIDYTVSLAAAMLCVANNGGDPSLKVEASRLLASIDGLADLREYDPIFRQHAKMMLAQPDAACTYSSSGWIDLDGAIAQIKRRGLHARNGQPSRRSRYGRPGG